MIWIQDYEEDKVVSDIEKIARRGKRQDSPLQMYVWSCTKGLYNQITKMKQDIKDPLNVLQYIETKGTDRTIYVLKNFHYYLDKPVIIQQLKDLIPICKANERHLIFVSYTNDLPAELEKDIALITYPAPSKELLNNVLDNLLESNNIDKSSITERERLLDSARGLTISEAENAFALAYVQHRSFNNEAIKTVQQLKTKFIRKSGVLEYIEPQFTLDDIGGLENLKEWLRQREKAFTPEAREFGIPLPKGILLTGVPGSGKSLTAKAVAVAWKLPLIKFDLSQIFNSLVGESEKRMREALRTIEAVSPCICWIDEIEKGLAGSTSTHDSGVAARVFGQFLTWMQEKKEFVFVIATANNISALPPEFMRKGRFDEFFWVDLPTFNERKEIFSIHLKKRKRNVEFFDLNRLAEETEGFSGAEIESLVVSGLYYAFEENRELQTEDIIKAINETTPLSISMKEKIAEMREWAQDRFRYASKIESMVNLDDIKTKSNRKLTF